MSHHDPEDYDDDPHGLVEYDYDDDEMSDEEKAEYEESRCEYEDVMGVDLS